MNIAGERVADPPGQRRSLSEMVFDRMLRSIKSGAYSADERLPTEHDLAAEFQVSRPVVREALRKLRDQGLVYSRQGAGSFVRQAGIRQPLGFGQVENIADLHRCYEFRLMLEPAAAEAAAERHRPETLAAIAQALAAMRDATERRGHREDADFALSSGDRARRANNQYFETAMRGAERPHRGGDEVPRPVAANSASAGWIRCLRRTRRDPCRDPRPRRPPVPATAMAAHLRGSRDRLFEGRWLELSSTASSEAAGRSPRPAPSIMSRGVVVHQAADGVGFGGPERQVGCRWRRGRTGASRTPRSRHQPGGLRESRRVRRWARRPSAASTLRGLCRARAEALKASTCGKMIALARPCGRLSRVPSG